MVRLLAALAACAPDPARPDGPDPTAAGPNVLLVVLDDVGVRDVGTYGDPAAPPTPVLDALAATGVRFTQAWASPVCSPSRAAILTGRHGTRTGVGVRVDPGDLYELPEDEVTIAEVLAGSPEGYTSHALGKWHLAGGAAGAPHYDAPVRQGFASFAGSIANLDLHSAAVDQPTSYFRWERCGSGPCALTDRYATTALVDDAVALLARTPEPWFLYAAFHAAHDPYHVPPDPLNPTGVRPEDGPRAKYDAMIGSVDAELGRLLDGLDPEVRDRTTVIVIGDNGTPEGMAVAPDLASEVKGSVHPGGVHVPLIVSGAGVGAPGSDCAALVHAVDLLPTVAELGSADPVAPIDGRSLVPFLSDPDQSGRERMFTAFLRANGPPPWPSAQYAVRDARFQLLSLPGGEELYDLEAGRNGPDLLAGGPLDPAAAAALDGLRAALAEALAVPYAH